MFGFARIDTGVADAEPDPSEGSYDGAASDLFFSLGDYEASASSGLVFIRNGTAPSADEFYLSGEMSGADVGGFPVGTLIVDLIDTTTAVLSDDSIPSSLDLADFDAPIALLQFDDGNSNYTIEIDITSLGYLPVPEPAGGLLALVGSLVLGTLRRSAVHRP